MIHILVICNNRDKCWCPYGEKNCTCDSHDPREFKDGEYTEFSCTDKNYKDKKCRLQNYQEYKISNQLLQNGYDSKQINALLVLIRNGVTPNVYEKCYKERNK